MLSDPPGGGKCDNPLPFLSGILIADIDRGGVFAHLVGTLDLLSPSEQNRVIGFVINRFRGDIGLLQPGLDWLEQRTGKPVLGVLPYLHGLMLDAEDAIAPVATMDANADPRVDPEKQAKIKIVAPVVPRISNHNDLDPLRLHPEVDFRWVGLGEDMPLNRKGCDLIVLPGSKAVRADLDWLRAQGREAAIKKHLRYGGKLIGLCGGYQMLGHHLHDPLGLEGAPGSTPGLGLLDADTTLAAEKQLRNVSGHLALPGRPAMTGYEIHLGVTHGTGLAHPAALSALLAWAGLEASAPVDYPARREADLDRLADAVEAALDWGRLAGVLPGGEGVVE